MSQSPQVSVFIPVYNGAAYLEQTIRAVVAQTHDDWELIIVDNASTDGTAILLRRLLGELADERIRVITNPSTVPAPENWNVGRVACTGEFLKMICADDIPVSDSIERQVKALLDNPSASVASGSRIIINADGRERFVRNGIGRTGLYEGRKIIRRCLMAGTNIVGDPVNVMWRRSAMERIGAFDPSVVYCTDIDYWLRMLGVGDLYFDAKPTGYYRVHAGAAAVGLAQVAAQDFIRVGELQVKLGNVSLSRFEEWFMKKKSFLASLLRQTAYRLLG
jgi:glycosyltransferase involved in cell wall biosynthesis